jgi:hypothetical protein
MGPLKILLLPFALIIPVLVGVSLSFSDVRVELKNGSSITADDCRESGTNLLCSTMGGTFEIEKRDIVRIRTVKGGGADDSEVGTPETGAADAKETDTLNAGKTPVDDSSDRRKAAAKRLEEIQKRQSELNSEREKLIKDREKLQEDLTHAPDWMPDKQHDELQKRNSDLDERLKRFNEEVKELNNEGKKISQELRGGPPGSPRTSGSPGTPAAP